MVEKRSMTRTGLNSCLSQLGNILIACIWVATCAMTPEFIWRGARIAVHHFDWGDLWAALLVGLILAFCIEPAVERLRHRWITRHHPHEIQPSNAATPNLVFPAVLGIVFAFTTVCLHDALTTFLASHAATVGARRMGLVNGLRIAGAWAFVPFCITFAWLTSGLHRIRLLTGIMALASPALAALVFAWAWQDWVTTEIPSIAILFVGYQLARVSSYNFSSGLSGEFFRRLAKNVAMISVTWLAAASLLDWLMAAFCIGKVILYTRAEFFVDLRFYIGWTIGMFLAPVPRVGPFPGPLSPELSPDDRSEVPQDSRKAKRF